MFIIAKGRNEYTVFFCGVYQIGSFFGLIGFSVDIECADSHDSGFIAFKGFCCSGVVKGPDQVILIAGVGFTEFLTEFFY